MDYRKREEGAIIHFIGKHLDANKQKEKCNEKDMEQFYEYEYDV